MTLTIPTTHEHNDTPPCLRALPADHPLRALKWRQALHDDGRPGDYWSTGKVCLVCGLKIACSADAVVEEVAATIRDHIASHNLLEAKP